MRLIPHPDPMVDFVAGWQCAIDGLTGIDPATPDEAVDAYCDLHINPRAEQARTNPPAIESIVGFYHCTAFARFLISEGDAEAANSLLSAAVTYLEEIVTP